MGTTSRGIIFGGFFVFNGPNHFMNVGMMPATQGRRYACPQGRSSRERGATTCGQLIGRTWRPARHRFDLIAVFVLHVSFVRHDFWGVPEEENMNEQVNVMKNMGLSGPALLLMAGASN